MMAGPDLPATERMCKSKLSTRKKQGAEVRDLPCDGERAFLRAGCDVDAVVNACI